MDASKYIEELKQKVEGLNAELGSTSSADESSSTSQNEQFPMVINSYLIILVQQLICIVKIRVN